MSLQAAESAAVIARTATNSLQGGGHVLLLPAAVAGTGRRVAPGHCERLRGKQSPAYSPAQGATPSLWMALVFSG